jgi:hypothetical protein
MAEGVDGGMASWLRVGESETLGCRRDVRLVKHDAWRYACRTQGWVERLSPAPLLGPSRSGGEDASKY